MAPDISILHTDVSTANYIGSRVYFGLGVEQNSVVNFGVGFTHVLKDLGGPHLQA